MDRAMLERRHDPAGRRWTAPADGSATNDTTLHAFAGDAGNAAGCDSATVTVKIWEREPQPRVRRCTRRAPARAARGSTRRLSLAQGTYTARSEQSDSRQHRLFPAQRTHSVDTTAPSVTPTSPANGLLTNDVTPSLSGCRVLLWAIRPR